MTPLEDITLCGEHDGVALGGGGESDPSVFQGFHQARGGIGSRIKGAIAELSKSVAAPGEDFAGRTDSDAVFVGGSLW